MSAFAWPNLLPQSYSYPQYRNLISELLQEKKSTGPVQSEKRTHYSELNLYRMNRLEKTVVLQDSLVQALAQISEPWIWLVFTEGWCGDSAQILPVLDKMAAATPHIELRFLLRDEHLPVMDQYLTNGGRSIPKLICLRAADLEELGTWGPQPAPLRQMVLAYKADPGGVSYEDFGTVIQTWYTKDKTQTLQQEFEVIIQAWIEKSTGYRNG